MIDKKKKSKKYRSIIRMEKCPFGDNNASRGQREDLIFVT